MIEMALSGLIAGVGLLIVFFKLFNGTIRKRILGFEVYFDVGITMLLAYMFMGTYSGMTAAMVGGIAVSAALRIASWLGGYSKLEMRRCGGCWTDKFIWKDYPGAFERHGWFTQPKQVDEVASA